MNDVQVLKSSIRGDVHYEIIGATREGVENRRDDLLGQYHPMGYGTSFSAPVLADDGHWRCHGSRRSTCD